MKVKKTTTEKVLAANRANAQKSTGPRRPDGLRLNALKHGFLTRNLIFNSDEEKQEFHDLVSDLAAEYPPAGPSESALVDELAVSSWQLGKLHGCAALELENRRKATQHILEQLGQSEHCENAPFFGDGYGAQSSRQLGWDCQELIVRTGSATSENDRVFDDKSTKRGNWHLEAKLQTSLEAISRYEATWERKFYRAFDRLRQIRRERLEAGEVAASTIPDQKEAEDEQLQ